MKERNLTGGLLALLLLVLIVAIVVLKAWRIANENPVLSIKSE